MLFLLKNGNAAQNGLFRTEGRLITSTVRVGSFIVARRADRRRASPIDQSLNAADAVAAVMTNRMK